MDHRVGTWCCFGIVMAIPTIPMHAICGPTVKHCRLLPQEGLGVQMFVCVVTAPCRRGDWHTVVHKGGTC